ncbi:hypothetical protein TIFTF001_028322 [Ficus carica]|uniref:Protein FAR1-RELATED SEQUENCE n=1 Tax=Ficus carica TaxID=3494 RepID=A0AA88DPT0_FICCA|nr:hypothetical protein TIFTF001_028322 [Ficus carica]
MDVELVDGEGESREHRVRENTELSKGEKKNVNASSTGRDLSNQEDVGNAKPQVGMEFDTEDAAKMFYDSYARRVGFSTHVGQFSRSKPDGPIVTWEFACSREVFKRKNVESCNAMLRLEKKDANGWVVTKFTEDHNHSMTTPGKVHYLRPRRHFAGATKNGADTLDSSSDIYVSIDGNHVSHEPSCGAVYNARKQWAPVYFRGTFFAALSSSQGVSSFFDGYVNQQTTIPLFFKQYERALENSLEKEIEADYDTICTTPVLKTPSPMEQQAANLYTKKVFAKFQEELVETFVYTANNIEDDGVVTIKYAEEGAVSVETYNAAIGALREGGKKIAAVKKNVAKVAQPTSQGGVNSQDESNKRGHLSALEMVSSLWPWQEAMPHHFNLNDAGIPVSDLNQPNSVSIHRDSGPSDNNVVLTCFKSMTWVIENKNSTQASKVAVINLKLQDYGQTPTGETEVQFRLTRVTLEPMLRSMAYISQQLSTPANKVAVINLKSEVIALRALLYNCNNCLWFDGKALILGLFYPTNTLLDD